MHIEYIAYIESTYAYTCNGIPIYMHMHSVCNLHMHINAIALYVCIVYNLQMHM